MGRIQKKKVSRTVKSKNSAKLSTDEHDTSSDHNEESKSSFLSECEHAFATTDFYTILNLEKDKAKSNDSNIENN